MANTTIQPITRLQPHLPKELIAAEPDIAARTIYCGPIDAFYDFRLGTLEYRSLRFETETLDEQDHQGVAVVNYTEREIPYTRIIEHKHFEFGTQDRTVITREYPADWKPGDEPYYPINDAKNDALYRQSRSWRRRRATWSSPVAWAATSTTTWTRPSPPPSSSSATSWAWSRRRRRNHPE